MPLFSRIIIYRLIPLNPSVLLGGSFLLLLFLLAAAATWRQEWHLVPEAPAAYSPERGAGVGVLPADAGGDDLQLLAVRLCAGRAQPGILSAGVEEGAGGGGGGRPLQLAGEFFLIFPLFLCQNWELHVFFKISIYFRLCFFCKKKELLFPFGFLSQYWIISLILHLLLYYFPSDCRPKSRNG